MSHTHIHIHTHTHTHTQRSGQTDTVRHTEILQHRQTDRQTERQRQTAEAVFQLTTTTLITMELFCFVHRNMSNYIKTWHTAIRHQPVNILQLFTSPNSTLSVYPKMTTTETSRIQLKHHMESKHHLIIMIISNTRTHKHTHTHTGTWYITEIKQHIRELEIQIWNKWNGCQGKHTNMHHTLVCRGSSVLMKGDQVCLTLGSRLPVTMATRCIHKYIHTYIHTHTYIYIYTVES